MLYNKCVKQRIYHLSNTKFTNTNLSNTTFTAVKVQANKQIFACLKLRWEWKENWL